MITVSKHARDRINNRLRGLISMSEVEKALRDLGPIEIGKTTRMIKVLDRHYTLDERSESGEFVHGNSLWVIVRRADEWDSGALSTIVLREVSQKHRSMHENYVMAENHRR